MEIPKSEADWAETVAQFTSGFKGRRTKERAGGGGDHGRRDKFSQAEKPAIPYRTDSQESEKEPSTNCRLGKSEHHRGPELY